MGAVVLASSKASSKELLPTLSSSCVASFLRFTLSTAQAALPCASSAPRPARYCEIFEDGFERSKDACFKAFIRRAQGHRGLHNWEAAVTDLRECVPPASAEHRETRVLGSDFLQGFLQRCGLLRSIPSRV